MDTFQKNEFFEFIKKCPVFSSLADITILDLLPYLNHKKLHTGEILFTQGDPSQYVYLVMHGKFVLFFLNQYGEQKYFGKIFKYETIGELGALTTETRSLTARATANSEILCMPNTVFRDLCRDNPTMLLDVIKPVISRSLNAIRFYEERQDLIDKANETMDATKTLILPEKEKEKFEKIKTIKLFRAIHDEHLAQLLPDIKHFILTPGKILFQQGEASDFVYFLIAGKLSAVLTTGKGNFKSIGTILPGETVGELGVLSGFSRSLTVGALEDSELLGLPNYLFSTLCEEYPAVLIGTINPIINRSLQTLKLLKGGKIIENIAVFFAEDNENTTLFKEKFKKGLEGQNELIFISPHPIDHHEFLKLEKNAEKHNTKNLFMLDSLETITMTYLTERNADFYLIAEGNREAKINEMAEKIIKMISVHQNIKLYLVLFYHDSSARPSKTRIWLNKFPVHLHYHIRTYLESDFGRLFRYMIGTSTGLVLGGGGGKGLAHLGVIKALMEKKIEIDAIGGTSIGSIAGASYFLFAQSNELEKIFRSLFEKFYQVISMRRLVWPIISLFSANPADDAIKQIFDDILIEDMWLPYFCVSANLSKNSEVIHNKGSLKEAIRCSISTPGLVPPVTINGDLYVDGGLLNNLPVDIMRNLLGANSKVIASMLASYAPDNTKYFFPSALSLKETILARLGWIQYKHYKFPAYFDFFTKALLIGSSNKEILNSLSANILINPKVTKFKSIQVLKKYENEIINSGYVEAMAMLEEHDKK